MRAVDRGASLFKRIVLDQRVALYSKLAWLTGCQADKEPKIWNAL